jgi:hypothetical protein
MADLFSRLSLVQRRIFVMRLLGIRNNMIASDLAISEATVSNNLARMAELYEDEWKLSSTLLRLAKEAGIEEPELLAADDNKVNEKDQIIIRLLLDLVSSGTDWQEEAVPTVLEHLKAPGLALWGTGRSDDILEYGAIGTEWADSPNAYAYESVTKEVRDALTYWETANPQIRRRIFRPSSAALEAAIFDLGDGAWKEATRQNKIVFNRPSEPGNPPPRRVRLASFSSSRTEAPGRHESPHLNLQLNQAWYIQTMGSNHALHRRPGTPGAHTWPGSYPHLKAARVEETLPTGIHSLDQSELANLLSVNISVLSNDATPWILVQVRSERNATAYWPLQCSGAGFVDDDDGKRAYNSAPDVFAAAARELEQEALAEFAKPQFVRFLALCREFTNFEPGLVGFIQIPRPHEAVVLPPINRDEVKSFMWWPLAPEQFFRAMRQETLLSAIQISRHTPGTTWKEVLRKEGWEQAGWHRFVPLGAMSIIFTMLHVFKDPETIVDAWNRVAAEPLDAMADVFLSRLDSEAPKQ